MPRWISSTWLSNPPLFPAGAGGASGPVFALASPLNNAINVPLSSPIRIAVFSTVDPTPTVTIALNGTLAYALGSFVNGYAGFRKEFAGRSFIELAPLAGFTPGKLYNVSVEASDTLPTTTTTAWTFTTLPSTSYMGNALTNLERWLLTPLQRFLELEPLRQLLIQRALVDELANMPNRDNVAARALYQMAYESEISAALNPFASPNEDALASAIPTKRPTLELSTLLEGYTGRIQAGLAQLFESGAFHRDFRNNFADYLESLLYSYRVSAAATLVFLACAIEASSDV